jgi:ABC-2 type transport system ATP-binding protein
VVNDLMAEHCDRLAVIDQGRIVALDTPGALKDAIGGDIVTLRAADNAAAARELEARYGLSPQAENGTVSFTVAHGEEFLPGLVRELSVPPLAVGVRRPTLDDVFLELTGRAIREEGGDERGQLRQFCADEGALRMEVVLRGAWVIAYRELLRYVRERRA